MNIQKSSPTLSGIPKDLILIQKILYDTCNLNSSQPTADSESTEYGACTFSLNNSNILFRTAKITPTKTGQFVTLWKRVNQGSIQPYDSTDPIDFFMICTRKNDQLGLFIFPKSILITKGIITDKKEGKRAIRVYPPWDTTSSIQAQKTQQWQLHYFLECPKDQKIDLNLIKSFFLPEDKQ